MNEHDLKQLIQSADVPPPSGRAQLAERVRRQVAADAARRRTRLMVTGIAAAIGAVVVLTPTAPWGATDNAGAARIAELPAPATHTRLSPAEVAQLRAELAEIDAKLAKLDQSAPRGESEWVEAEVALALAVEQTRAELAHGGQSALNAAARTLVEKGDRLCFEYHACDAAVDVWQDVRRMFPGTSWATLADRRVAARMGI